MELNNTTIINLCNNFLNEQDIRQYLDVYKEKNISIRIVFLDLFIKYPLFPSKNIIIKMIDTNLDMPTFFSQLLSNFIDYFNSLNIQQKELLKDSSFSFMKFIMKYIIRNENDKTENYKIILYNFHNIDEFYEKYLTLLLRDFNNCCVNCIKNNENNPNFNLDYLIKYFDFLSKIGVNKEDEMYLSLKELFFNKKSDKIILKLYSHLNDFIEQDIIKSELILILENKYSDNNKSQYSLFIGKYANLNKEYNNKFKLLYLNMLDKEKLITCIQNNINDEIKKYNFNLIFKSINNKCISKNDKINDNNKKEEEDYKNIQNSEINFLKDNLIVKRNRDYFYKQINKYSKFIPKDSIFYKFTKDKNIDKNEMSLFINKKRFPLIHEIFNDLLERIQLNKNYDGTFGYIVINNKDYIYTYHNENIIAKPIYDSEHINKYTYEDIFKNVII